MRCLEINEFKRVKKMRRKIEKWKKEGQKGTSKDGRLEIKKRRKKIGGRKNRNELGKG